MKHSLRFVILLALAAHLAAAPATFVQAVDFPYRSFPRQLWERELVWMKNIGLDSITIAPARGWTEAETAPLIKILRRLGMKVYVRVQPGGPSSGEIESTFATQMIDHGGPVVIGLPQPVARVSAISPNALLLSRAAIAARGSLVWTDVEDTRDRSGFHRGAVSFRGDEQTSATALRRNATLLPYWVPVLSAMQARKIPVSPPLKRPRTISAIEMISSTGTAAVNLSNETGSQWTGELRPYYPAAKREISIPNVHLRPGDAIFLPVNVPLSDGPLCNNCQALSKSDRIVYSTAELTAVEYENGILAMEFYAPFPAEAIVQLTGEPSGPFLAGGKPSKFDWDAATTRARLPIPAGKAPAYRMRIGLALQPPDSSAFFVDSKPLVIGQPNHLMTFYSSPEIAQRSRLILPPNLKAQRVETPGRDASPLQIEYRVDVPADAVHGDHVQLALEADGIQMGHVRLQVLRPASLRIRQAIPLHFGADRELPSDPMLIPVEGPTGRSIDVLIRNNSPEIRTFTLEASGDGVEFSPAKTEISIGGSMEREVPLRVFTATASGDQSAPGIHDCKFVLSGPVALETAARVAVIPRDKTVSYAVDLDGDGDVEHVLENQHIRAVFSKADGGRWMEFVWKDSNRNMLPENGVEIGKAAIDLRGSDLTIDRAGGPSIDALQPGKAGEATLSVDRPRAGQTVFSLRK